MSQISGGATVEEIKSQQLRGTELIKFGNKLLTEEEVNTRGHNINVSKYKRPKVSPKDEMKAGQSSLFNATMRNGNSPLQPMFFLIPS